MPIVLVSKDRPQDCDALPVFKKARRMFLGYPGDWPREVGDILEFPTEDEEDIMPEVPDF